MPYTLPSFEEERPVEPIIRTRRRSPIVFVLIGRCLDGLDVVFDLFSSSKRKSSPRKVGAVESRGPNLRLIHGHKSPYVSDHGP